jgi:hypothetical protein
MGGNGLPLIAADRKASPGVALPGVLPVGDGGPGLLEEGEATGRDLVFALVVEDPGRAECAEGGRVSAGLGGEAAAEAEHVCPPDKTEVGQLGQPAQGVGTRRSVGAHGRGR